MTGFRDHMTEIEAARDGTHPALLSPFRDDYSEGDGPENYDLATGERLRGRTVGDARCEAAEREAAPVTEGPPPARPSAEGSA